MKPFLLVCFLILALGIAACTEETQVTLYEQGEYKGKKDELPWNNPAPSYGSAQWDAGSKQSWERQLSRRVMAQNESVRIEHP